MDGILITARLKSTRLPKKILVDVNGQPLIRYLIDRLKKNTNKKLILCTSTSQDDDSLVDYFIKNNIDFFRGNEDDVLDRYYKCSKKFNLDKVYILYGDEPFVDIDLLNKTFNQLKLEKAMWIRNDLFFDGTFGYGFNKTALRVINVLKTNSNNEVWGEMVNKMPISILRNTPFKSISKENVRLCIDYPEDLEVFKKLLKALGNNYLTKNISEIIDIYKSLELFNINGFRSLDYNNRINNQSI